MKKQALRVAQTPVHDSLEAVLQATVEALGARWGSIALANGEDRSLHVGPSFGQFPSPELGMAAARWVVDRDAPLVLQNREQYLQLSTMVALNEELLPLMCMPIGRGNKVIGALLVNVPALSGDKDLPQKLHVLQLATTSIGCLLENDRLRQEVQEKEAYVMRLVSSTIEAQESERERICLEVHDGVGQTLAAAFQHLQALQSILPPQESQTRHMVSRTVALVRQAIQEAREVINSLTPATLSGLGLVSTLRQELKQFEKDTGCKVEFEADWPRLPQDAETALYRIIHEAVTNVRKHANSQKTRIELSRLPDRLIALIKDWGVGFDLSQQEAIPTRLSAVLFTCARELSCWGAPQIHSIPGQKGELWGESECSSWMTTRWPARVSVPYCPPTKT